MLAENIRRHLRGQLEFLLPGSAIALAIKADFVVVFRMKMQRLMRKDFNCAQDFSAALQQQLAIRSGELHQDLRRTQLLPWRDRRVHGDPVFQLESA